MNRLENKVAWISGATSGIGEATARLFAREGARVAIVGRRIAGVTSSRVATPRGRVHYFISESDQPMEMIWVSAGPTPERVIVDERCATVDGNPWREDHKT